MLVTSYKMKFEINSAAYDSYRQACSQSRQEGQRIFCSSLIKELEQIKLTLGTENLNVLDVGCGGEAPRCLSDFVSLVRTWDGVEPSEAINYHPNLKRRFHSVLEKADLPKDHYDLAFAYNVVEHVEKAEPFLKAMYSTLKKGGVFWAFTPNARHPFAVLSRTIELMGLKSRFAKSASAREGRDVVNDYPAYYRMNSASKLRAVTEKVGFNRLSIWYFPCRQWDIYFPRGIKLVPKIYDDIVGCRLEQCSLIMAMRFEK